MKKIDKINITRNKNGLNNISDTCYEKYRKLGHSDYLICKLKLQHGGFRKGSRDGKTKLDIRTIKYMIYSIKEFGMTKREVCRMNGVSDNYLINKLGNK